MTPLTQNQIDVRKIAQQCSRDIHADCVNPKSYFAFAGSDAYIESAINQALDRQRAEIYALGACPVEQVSHIPLTQFVKTRFVTVDEYNIVADKLQSAEDNAKRFEGVLPFLQEISDWMMENDYECGPVGSDIFERIHKLTSDQSLNAQQDGRGE